MNGVHNSYALARLVVAERSSAAMTRTGTSTRRRRFVRRRRRRVWAPVSVWAHPTHARPVTALA